MTSAVLKSNALGSIGSIKPVLNWAEASEHEESQKANAVENGIKTVIDEVVAESGKCQVITTYKVVHRKVPAAVAQRKNWRKFGASANDGPGPNIQTTYVTDEVPITFLFNRSGETPEEDSALVLKQASAVKSAAAGASLGHCRYCKSDDHWSVTCIYKNLYEGENKENVTEGRSGLVSDTPATSKYLPPTARLASSDRAAHSINPGRQRDRDDNTVRISNLPEEEWPDLEVELRQIFGQIGQIARFYLSIDKNKCCKGFAFCSFTCAEDADAAVQTLNGYRFSHLVLKVDLAVAKNKD